jgi:RNA polymerase sigma factor (sigma-70 family)
MRAPEDFVAWYRREHPRLLAAVVALTGDAHTAAELTDEAFTRALERWDRVRTMEAPTGWTFTVARNLVRRRHRRAALEARALRRTGAPGDRAGVDARPDVWAAVRALPTRQREVVLLRYVLDLPEAQIAETLRITRGTVASTLSDARRSLAQVLGDRAGDPEEVTP